MTSPITDLANPPLGIFPGIPESLYRVCAGVSQGNLKLVDTSPLHYFTATQADRVQKKSTPAQVLGIIAHSVILENKWNCVIKPQGMNLATKEGKAWKEAQTLSWITHDEAEMIKGMASAVKSHPEAVKILYGQGQNEVACWKQCPETGLLLKGRADRITMDDSNRMVLPDIKTCMEEGANEDDFRHAILKYKYYRQAAYYLDLFGASTFIFIAVEKEPPYGVAVYDVDPEDIALGRMENMRDLRIVKDCIEKNHWPCYSDKIKRISLLEKDRKRIRGEWV